MKKTLLSILPSLISICSYSQCINEVLPFKTGKTNFNTEEVMNAFNS